MGIFSRSQRVPVAPEPPPPPPPSAPAVGTVYEGAVVFVEGVHYPAAHEGEAGYELIWVADDGFETRVALHAREVKHPKPTTPEDGPFNGVLDAEVRAAHDEHPSTGHYEFFDPSSAPGHYDRYHRSGLDIDPELPGEELP